MLFNKNNQHSLMTFYIFVNLLQLYMLYAMCNPQGLCLGVDFHGESLSTLTDHTNSYEMANYVPSARASE